MGKADGGMKQGETSVVTESGEKIGCIVRKLFKAFRHHGSVSFLNLLALLSNPTDNELFLSLDRPLYKDSKGVLQ